jgi:hypothetical protein
LEIQRARQHVEHQKPPAALVAVVQAFDGDGDGRNDEGTLGTQTIRKMPNTSVGKEKARLKRTKKTDTAMR